MTKPSNACAKLSEKDLKAALINAWEQVEQNTREKMAPLLYYLHKKLLARGQKGKGFERWVGAELGIAVRTARRWVSWYAEQIGEKPPKEPTVTIGQVAESEDEEEDSEEDEDEDEDEAEPAPPAPDALHPVHILIMLTEAQEQEFLTARTELEDEQFSQVVFHAVVSQAAVRGPEWGIPPNADNNASASL